MSRNQNQQLYEMIQQSTNPLITFKKEATGDVIASSLALAKLFKKWGLSSEIVSPNFKLPDNYKFLPEASNIKNQVTNLKKVTITLDHPNLKPHHIDHQENENQLHLHINPNDPTFSKENIHIDDSNYKHDLIIALNTPDLSALDHLYEENTEFFYHVPIINIDYSPENEHYGHINLINITATSISEIVYDFIENIDSVLLDEQIATHLLTGMIEKTKSFKIPTITPKSLNVASQLMAAGAERDNIIKNLYQTRSVNTLRLWGKTLLKLETDPYQKVAWAEITEEDFRETNSSEKDLAGIMDELIGNIPTIEMTLIFFTTNNQKYSIVKSEKGLDLKNHFINFNPEGHKSLIKFPFSSHNQTIIDSIKQLV
jgi:nanoRNase/pAp phosphatase (c-di-AMP/oligoRNAs hydrolase)